MLDKQIIIYKKECYNEPYCSLNQVLEQLNAYKMEAEEGKEINTELKAENYYLKRKISHYENLLKLNFTKSRTAEEVVQHANYLREQGRIVLIEENHKLKQTLTEIKEIAEKDKEFCIKCNGNKDIDCIECIEGGRALLAKDILQKISEVEDES